MRGAFCFFLFFLFSSTAYAQIEVVVYGDDSYPPYSYTEDGQMKGIYTEILSRAFSRMPDYKVTLQGRPWKRGLLEISHGKIFALYPPYKREIQRPYMEYDFPILNETLIVICGEKVLSSPKPTWPNDYLGLTIGSNIGFSSGGAEYRKLVEAEMIQSDAVSGTSSNLLKLIAGRIDCYMNDELSIQWELKQLQKVGKYQGKGLKVGTTISSEHGYLGFSANGENFPFKAHFKSQYQQALSELKKSGEIQRIVEDFVQ
ncbi:substrate-binding periplasmic protein [Vibrio genomosp. F10 str. 9ZC157]|uniref:ABC transporter substrate-binding protein n=1 Tax=Vibrio genomosp. F10 str. ZF-129 TaxID=1187848 RepID=A0A1E5BGX3_9VIBR|nr:transporter substrate-binding domain-containing protein [Vibrio genomosp. F10]OEE35953.1 ABC transporter substrate-binding protein [Vibrio genomosp. F10 str. ZF-129]OEE92986.1 ABC transporter substrate-binding protein [Vibrio genomosp. F10 str. 9ZC157]